MYTYVHTHTYSYGEGAISPPDGRGFSKNLSCVTVMVPSDLDTYTTGYPICLVHVSIILETVRPSGRDETYIRNIDTDVHVYAGFKK